MTATALPRTSGRSWPTVRSRAVRRFLKNRAATASLAYLLVLVVAAILAPMVFSLSPNRQALGSRLLGPTADHWLGTDALGRDILARLLYGARVTLLAAAQGVGVAVVLGVPLGFAAGYIGRFVDASLNAVANAFMSIPPLLLAFAIVGIMGPGITNAMIAIGIILAPRFFRVARAAARGVRNETYIEAARSAGCSTWRVVWRHVMPNSAGPLLVQISFSVGLAIIAEASLSFLGLGVQDPQASWGSMAQAAFETMSTSAWSLIPPSIAIASTILAFSLLGDGIRDALGREAGGSP